MAPTGTVCFGISEFALPLTLTFPLNWKTAPVKTTNNTFVFIRQVNPAVLLWQYHYHFSFQMRHLFPRQMYPTCMWPVQAVVCCSGTHPFIVVHLELYLSLLFFSVRHAGLYKEECKEQSVNSAQLFCKG